MAILNLLAAILPLNVKNKEDDKIEEEPMESEENAFHFQVHAEPVNIHYPSSKVINYPEGQPRTEHNYFWVPEHLDASDMEGLYHHGLGLY
ncbi:MAG: hypothetical protein WB791_03490 [Waddliaceae bacterium]